MRFYPSPQKNHRLSLAFGAAALICLLLLPGCHDAEEDASPPVAASLLSDVPAALPPTPALFTAVTAALPAPPISWAALPPRPPDPSRVAAQAAAPQAVVSAAVVSAAGQSAAPLNPGLIVCDPVSGSGGLSMFGEACGRWLDLMAAGQPELGQTPFWEARGRCRQELSRANFQLTPAEAAPLASMTGATHAACGTLTGTPARCTLTYRLYALPGGAAVGLPLAAAGTEAQIVAALPGLARTLDARLGVAAPRLPASVGLTAAELAQTEAISDQAAVSDADLLTLSRLSARSPLAGMYYVGTRAADDQVLLTGMTKTLLTQLPANTLVLSHLGYAEPGALRPYAAAHRTLFGHYPASALLAHTESWEQRLWGDRAGEWQAAARACRAAPRDPASWLTRTTTLENIGEDLRQGRLANDLSAADWAVLNKLYAQQEASALRTTTLDPRDGHAWKGLAQTATFLGDMVQAEAAYQKALALDPDKEEVYAWGLQMYQPKWGGDPAALRHIAALAAAEAWNNSADAVYVAASLDGAGFKTEAAQVLTDYITRQRAVTTKAPSDAVAHWSLAAALAAQKTPLSLREATLEYRTAAHFMPNAPAVHHWLADVLDQRHRTKDAVAEYRQAIALNPFDAATHLDLGFLFKREQRFPEARPELQLALRLDPRNAEAHYALGAILSRQNQPNRAAAEYSEAIRMEFYSIEAWVSLPSALDNSKQYDRAIAAGQEADHVLTEQSQANSETEPFVHDAVADAYLNKKEWTSSLAQSEASLTYNPSDAVAHENLAEAYIGQGHKAEAQTEWKRTIALGDPQVAPVARRLLAAHP